jgi:nickel superoxide dismutase
MDKDGDRTSVRFASKAPTPHAVAVDQGWLHRVIGYDESRHERIEYVRDSAACTTGPVQGEGGSKVGLFKSVRVAHAHCDLMCGVYDPAQAKIEAMSVLKACEKMAASDDPVFRDRGVIIKEERAELVKHHLSVLWTDFFKPHHLEAFPDLHDKFWMAIKAAGDAKKSNDAKVAQKLIDAIDEISDIFWKTEYSPN